jgi:Zn-dependent peptidase ImmA (M78 family)
MPVRRKRIHDIVHKLLKANRIKRPPVPVDQIARAQGIVVRYQPYEGDELSGFLYRNRKAAVIGVNARHHPNRQRFTIAHELGHFLLHRESFYEEVHVDRAIKVMLRSDLSSQGVNIEEIEANAFAAELLLPAEFLKQDLAELGTVDVEDEHALKQLARRYRVSTQALLLRLSRLGYVILL